MQDQSRAVPNDDEGDPYEEVQVLPRSSYAELRRNQEDVTTSNNNHQKCDSDYVVPIEVHEEPSYEAISKNMSLPGYTKLDQTKRDLDDSVLYQKLRKT